MMNIYKAELLSFDFYPALNMGSTEGLRHIKSLPVLSVVQALTGSYDIGIDNSPVFSTGAGGAFIAPAISTQYITHHDDPNTGSMTARWLFFDLLINERYRLDEVFTFPVLVPQTALPAVTACFDELTKGGGYLGDAACILRLADQLVQLATGEKPHQHEALFEAAAYIRRHLDTPHTVEELAHRASMSVSGFYTAFKRQFGRSPIDYINHLRISVAADRLENGEESIGNIALSLGFSDPFYFSRVFKKTFGISPREYRNRHA